MERRIMLSLLLIVIVSIGMVIYCANKNNKPNYIYDNEALTYVVYNASLGANEIMEPKTPSNHHKTNPIEHFVYDYIQVYQAHQFFINLDSDFVFLEELLGSKEIEVIISFFGLSSDEHHWYAFRMIIFKYEEKMIGCMGGDSHLINDLNSGTKIDDLTKVNFQTCHFLTNNAVVKYYDEHYPLYDFNVNLSDLENIKVEVVGNGKAFDADYETTIRSYRALAGSYRELDSSEVYHLLELIVTKKQEIIVKIESIDYESGIIYVNCPSYPSLKSLQCNGEILDLESLPISLDELNPDDELKTYIFLNFHMTEPINILVGFLQKIN